MNKNIKKIHMIGICGVAMGTLAGMLKEKGYSVSGSDHGVYPPMVDMLNEWGIEIFDGFDAANVGNPDLVIIGNVISRGNVEAEYVLNNRIPYLSMAQSLYDFFLKGKEIISISGTHGKTTTTALLSHIMETAGENPSYLIGGVSKNYNTNYKIGDGRYFIIEGDEYDSAFFEKVPKFIQYKPHHLILTSLEFDHADIYNNIDEIETWFKRLVKIIPSNGNIVYSSEYENLKDIISGSLSNCYSYGNSKCDFCCNFSEYTGMFSNLKIENNNTGKIDLKTRLFGEFNYSNISAAVSMALLLGIEETDIQRSLETFQGVKRRQELIYDSKELKIFEDFAHHPTEIRSVLDGIKERFHDCILWAIYEPRSATSRRNIMENELTSSFDSAEKILIKTPFNLESIPGTERIDIHKIVSEIKKKEKEINLFDNVDEIVKFTYNNIDREKKNIIVIMSNGGFDGIYEKLIQKFK